MHVNPKFRDEKLNSDPQPVPGCLPGAARKDVDDNGASYLVSEWVVHAEKETNLFYLFQYSDTQSM